MLTKTRQDSLLAVRHSEGIMVGKTGSSLYSRQRTIHMSKPVSSISRGSR